MLSVFCRIVSDSGVANIVEVSEASYFATRSRVIVGIKFFELRSFFFVNIVPTEIYTPINAAESAPI